MAVLLTNANTAAAQTPAERTMARNLAHEGQQALIDGDFETSAERFLRASKLVDAPTLRLGLARARVGQGRLVEAYELYQAISREALGPKAPKAFVRAVESARAEGSELEARLAWITLQVTGYASGEQPTVKVNDVLVSNASLGIRRPVDPGTVTVTATLDGYQDARATLDVAEGEPNVVLSVRLKQKAEVTPEPALTVPPPIASEPETDANPNPFPLRWVSYGLLGVGGATLVTGGVFGALSAGNYLSLRSDCRKSGANTRACPDSSNYLQRDARWHDQAIAAAIFASAGAVLAGGGLVLYYLYPEGEDSEHSWVHPVVGPGFVGAQGRF